MTKLTIPLNKKKEIIRNVKNGKTALYLTPFSKVMGQQLYILPINKKFSINKNNALEIINVRFPNPKPNFKVNNGRAFKSKRFLTINDSIKNIL